MKPGLVITGLALAVWTLIIGMVLIVLAIGFAPEWFGYDGNPTPDLGGNLEKDLDDGR